MRIVSNLCNAYHEYVIRDEDGITAVVLFRQLPLFEHG